MEGREYSKSYCHGPAVLNGETASSCNFSEVSPRILVFSMSARVKLSWVRWSRRSVHGEPSMQCAMVSRRCISALVSGKSRCRMCTLSISRNRVGEDVALMVVSVSDVAGYAVSSAADDCCISLSPLFRNPVRIFKVISDIPTWWPIGQDWTYVELFGSDDSAASGAVSDQ